MESNVRKGRCRNYGDCDQAGKEFTIEEGKPFECPECHQPLVPLDGPKVKGKRKKSPLPLIIGGAVVLVAIVVGLIFAFSGQDDEEVVVPVVKEAVDSLSVVQETVTNRNDTLVIINETVQPAEEVTEDEVEAIVEEAPATEPEPAPAVATQPVSKPAAPKAPAPAPAASHKLSYGSWTGGWKNGQPHGTGTMTYSTSHQIDSRDTKGRVAQPGEYIVGEWDNGHLVQGRWFKKDGSKEAVIIGKAG